MPKHSNTKSRRLLEKSDYQIVTVAAMYIWPCDRLKMESVFALVLDFNECRQAKNEAHFASP